MEIYMKNKNSYYQNNLIHLKKYQKRYYKKNKNKRIKYNNQWRLNHKKHRKLYYIKNKNRAKGYELKRNYGITLFEKKQIIIKQNYRCLSCNTDLKKLNEKSIHIDHDHVTNKIRGVLCASCNLALGILEENPKKIYKLYLYINNIKKNNH
jgi:hypothetical protein